MKFLSFFVFAILFISCKPEKNDQQIVQDHIISYLKGRVLPTVDFEFVSIANLDTVTEKEYIDREMEVLTLSLTNKDVRIKRMDSLETVLKTSLAHHPNDQTLTTNINDITRSKTALYVQQHKLDSLKAAIKPEMSQTVKFIGFNYSFYSKNAAGARTLYHYYVKLDENLNVLSVTDVLQ